LARHDAADAVRPGEVGRRAPTIPSLAQLEEFQAIRASRRAIKQEQFTVFAGDSSEPITATLWHEEHSSRSKIVILLVQPKGVGIKHAKRCVW
jgi:hypothetical protein